MVSDREDKRTLGVTPQGAAALEALMETGWFPSEVDAYRVAISVALARGLDKLASDMSGVTTKWNIGTLDPEGELKDLLSALEDAPPDRPYAAAERRAAAGLDFLKQRLVDAHASLADVLGAVDA